MNNDVTLFTSALIGDRAVMLLDKQIGPDPESSTTPYLDGSRFADEMYYWKNQGKAITVKINSPGGRLTHGWSMIDAIRETNATTENIGMAYSMAGICLLTGKNRKANDYASFMFHAPRGGTKEYQPVVNAQFRSILETHTQLAKAEIDEMMTSGKDYKFDAKQMLTKGIIDEIIPTGKRVAFKEAASVSEMHEWFASVDKQSAQADAELLSMHASYAKGKADSFAIDLTTEWGRLYHSDPSELNRIMAEDPTRYNAMTIAHSKAMLGK